MLRKRHKLIAVVTLTILILLYRHLQSSWDAQQLKLVALNDGQRSGGAPLSNIDKSDTLASGESVGRLQDEESPASKHAAHKANDGKRVDSENPTPAQGDNGTSAGEIEEISSGTGPDGRSRNNVHTEVSFQSQDETERVLGQVDEDHSSKPTSDVASPTATPTGGRWKKPKEHFPLPKESIITLPPGSAKYIPRIQHIFPTESEELKEKRLRRLTMVKNEIQRSWAGYKQYAWMHDEITPVSNRSRDPFCGWAATLVDSLDTLWIAGLKDEFDEAAAAVKTIDFTYTNRSTIPVFETTIRYLGGLLAAYDVSGGASGNYSFLLNKAVELAEVLMGIFDTPNRMPVLYYHWRPEDTSRARRARRAGMAEIATLSMEFTRLAQVTGRHEYYDAIDRITNALIDMQRTGTLIPGLFPHHLDTTGCNVTAAIEQKLKSKASTKQADFASNLKERKDYTTTGRLSSTNVDDHREPSFSLHPREISAEASLAADEVTVDKLPRDGSLPNGDSIGGHDERLGCITQGVVPVDNGYQEYHMGGGQDSAYEYFGKEYLLLGGKETKYQKLYEDTVDGINKHLLFRPMIPDDWDIIFPARVGIKSDTNIVSNIDYEVTHLTCFIGGMYALGGKLFGRQKDIEYAAKLTNGCVWAYQSTASGIMPEFGYLVPCPTFKQCSFNETLWRQALDPLADSRDQQMEQHEQRKAERQKEDMVRVRTDRVGKVVSAEHNTDSQTSFSSSRVALEKTSALEERIGIPVTPSDPNLFTSRASDEEVKAVVAEKGLEYGAVRSQTRNKQVPESKSELSTFKEENPRRSRPSKVPALRPHHSQRPRKPPTHQEFVEEQIQKGVPRGFSSVSSEKYILRPEAIESVWYMYRITGDASWMEKGWAMFEATMKATRTPSANTAIANVLSQEHEPLDTMESFWLAETLKYYYLLFSEPSLISLDEWVLNTEAHPFKLETKA